MDVPIMQCPPAVGTRNVSQNCYSGRKIIQSFGNVTVRGGKMERARGERDCQQSV
jgi:hypothetical protein